MPDASPSRPPRDDPSADGPAPQVAPPPPPATIPGVVRDAAADERSAPVLQAGADRQAFLLALSDALRACPDEPSVTRLAVRMLGEHLRLDRCYVSEVFEAEDCSTVGPEHVRPGLPSMVGRYRLSDYPETQRHMATQPLVIDDAQTDPRFSDQQKAMLALVPQRALLVAPLRKGPRAIVWAMAGAMATPRRWTDGERALMEAVAERTWAAVERARAEAALRASEEKYRTLFSEMDEAYAVVDVLADDGGDGTPGRWVDFRFVEVNPAFMRHTGMPDPVGRTATELLGTPNPRWAELYGRVAETGESVRVEESELTLGRVFDLNVVRLGGAGSRRVAVLFTDVTARKRAEAALAASAARQAYLVRLGDALRPLADPAAIQAAAARVLGEHLGATRVMYAEVEGPPGAEVGTIRGRYVAAGDAGSGDAASGDAASGPAAPFPDRYAYGTFGERVMALRRRGEPMVVADVTTDPAFDAAERAAWAAGGVRAAVTVPLVKGGRFVADFGVQSAGPRAWTADEVALVQETAERTWSAVELVRVQRRAAEANALLVRFADEARGHTDPQRIAEAASRLVAEALGVERAYWAEVDWATREYVVGAAFHAPGAPVVAGRFPLDAWEPFTALHLAGRPVVVDDTQADPRVAPAMRAAYRQLGVGADLATPVATGGRLRCTLAVNQRVPRHWTQEEVALVQRVADRCWAEVERARGDAALRASEEQFRRSIEEAPIPVIMHAEDGEVLQVSRTWTELTGYTVSDVPTFDAWLTRAYGEGADAVRAHVHALFAGDRRTMSVDFPVRTRGGELRHWSFSASAPGALADGRRFVVGMALDVTARRRAEEALRASEARYRTLVEHARDYAIFLLDAEGRVTEWPAGAERVTGFPAAEALGQPLARFYPPEDVDAGVPQARLAEAAAEGRGEWEGWRVRKDGTRF